MVTTINNEQTKFKDLVYEESIWTGRRTLSYDGVVLHKIKRGVYACKQGEQTEQITVKGNQLIGVTVTLFGQQIELLRKARWYEWALSILVLMAGVVFACLNHDGDSIALCALVSGICGGIGGGLYFANFYLLRRVDKLYLKIILSVEFTVAAALLCYIVSALIFKTFIPVF